MGFFGTACAVADNVDEVDDMDSTTPQRLLLLLTSSMDSNSFRIETRWPSSRTTKKEDGSLVVVVIVVAVVVASVEPTDGPGEIGSITIEVGREVE